jgi:hypothetical protein
MKRKYRKHTYEAYQIMIKMEIKSLQLWFKDYKMEKWKILQKIEHICGSVYLDGITAFTSP